MNNKSGITVLGIFAADTVYHAKRMPAIAETIIGSDFTLGPGGKGSNQAVAASRAGGQVTFISKIGCDTFGALALATLHGAGVRALLTQMEGRPTGAAFIYVNETTGDNSIIVVPGAAATMSVEDVDAYRVIIERSAVFVTQLELSLEVAYRGLEIAHKAGVITIFNPAPARDFPEELYGMCDYIVPNEVEASAIVGFEIKSEKDAVRAAEILLVKGAQTALITLGARGVLFHSATHSEFVPAFSVGKVVDTTGAGDAFLGGFSSAVSRGFAPLAAVRFGCVAAGIAVTRRGAAQAMPLLAEIEQYV